MFWARCKGKSGLLPPPTHFCLLSLCPFTTITATGRPWQPETLILSLRSSSLSSVCWNLAYPTKGSHWCTTVHGVTSVSVGRQHTVNTLADVCHDPPWRMNKWWWCCSIVDALDISRFYVICDLSSNHVRFCVYNIIWGSTEVALIPKMHI